MILTTTLTKKLLELIIHETFSKFGSISCSSLLDSLKLLGFSYATSAGISITIEDLKTPDSKKKFIEQTNFEIKKISKEWEEGNISDVERFQTILDNWNIATESLKNRIIDYYQQYDPTNNLYIMAFSGARGNMSQVRQLVGMRGLMSDQEGKIIDLPIQSNFREGLSSIDYIISSYGARKGIVDTALKTADSGYLTRRLIYIAQDLVIREKDCKTKTGILCLLEKKNNFQFLIGRYLISAFSLSGKNKEIILEEKVVEKTDLDIFKEKGNLILNIRSSLTCLSPGSICKLCYGWDLSHLKLISFGEAVGIIAAQSIGEPGTQLTMRTFHTGGIFTSELGKQIKAPFSGKLFFPESMKTLSYRTSHGIFVLKLQQEMIVCIIDWKGNRKEIFLERGSFLYAKPFSFVKKDEVLAEIISQSFLSSQRKLKPIYSYYSGEVKFENLLIRKIFKDKKTLKVNQDDGILWVLAGKSVLFPKESYFLNQEILTKKKPFSSLFFSVPFQGVIQIFTNKLTILNNEEKISLKFDFSLNLLKNCDSKILLFVKNYQYIDAFTQIGTLHLFPTFEGFVYLIRKKESKYDSTFFFITEKDIWKVNFDLLNQPSLIEEQKNLIKSGIFLNSKTRMKMSGFLIRKDGFKFVFQKAYPIFLTRGTILNYKQGDFVFEKKILANLVTYRQQTEDIVQGLPKIEELIEARRPVLGARLSLRPGILLSSNCLDENRFYYVGRSLKENIIHCFYGDIHLQPVSVVKKLDKQCIYISHSVFYKENFIIYQNNIYQFYSLPPIYKPKKKKKQKKNIEQYQLKDFYGDKLIIQGKLSFSSWIARKINSQNEKELTLYKYSNKGKIPWLKLKSSSLLFENKKGDLYFSNEIGRSIFLEYKNPISEYQLPINAKILFEPGNFIDLGEPFTEGIVDLHDLLSIFFQYHLNFDGKMKGLLKSVQKFQLILVHSIQAIYQSQGVSISTKHIEIIVRQMTSKVMIKQSGDTPLLPGEFIRFSLLLQLYNSLKAGKEKKIYQIPNFEPFVFSSTNLSLTKEGFLSSAGFQETKRVLTKAAIEGTSEWLRGLKECLIIGRIIPAGTSFFNYKNFLDNLYLFQNLKAS
jgi:hypothetical protein